jgi:hypothetical protein
VRRAALAERFAETRCELGAVLAGLDPADVSSWGYPAAEARRYQKRVGEPRRDRRLKEHTQRKVPQQAVRRPHRGPRLCRERSASWGRALRGHFWP